MLTDLIVIAVGFLLGYILLGLMNRGSRRAVSRRPRGRGRKSEDQLGREAAGRKGERRFLEIVQAQGRRGLVSGSLETDDIAIEFKRTPRWFQLDHLVLVRDRGLLVVEVKNWVGDIHASADGAWIQERRDAKGHLTQIKRKNPVWQVERATRLFTHLLRRRNLTTAPVARAVVFVNPRCRLIGREKIAGRNTPVLTASEFERLLTRMRAKQPHRGGLDQQFFGSIEQALEAHARPFGT